MALWGYIASTFSSFVNCVQASDRIIAYVNRTVQWCLSAILSHIHGELGIREEVLLGVVLDYIRYSNLKIPR